jgi:nucleotide-binding universal stress UspA family protein
VKRLLIAYDGSPAADVAIEDLRIAGLPEQLEVKVLSVAEVILPSEPPDNPPSPDSISPWHRQIIEESKAEVAAMRRLAEGASERVQGLYPGWKVEPVVEADSPAWAVNTRAKQWKADLILLGAHSHSAVHRWILGSVAHQIAVEAPCSVRIARGHRHGGANTPLRNMIAVDGSIDSRQVIQSIANRSWPRATQFQVVTVIDPKMKTAVHWPSPESDHWVKQHFQEFDEWLCRMVDESAHRLKEHGHEVESPILEGKPKHELLQQAERWGADCIFLGARGLQHRDRYLLGSLASAMAVRAPCSVEIVRS